MIVKEQRIPIPNDPEKIMDLGMKVYARHCVMGKKSPLLALQTNSWEENGHDVNNALRLHEFIQEKNMSQEYLRKYDELIIKIKASIQASHDLLYEIYHDNPSELGFWGFDLEK